MMDLPGAVTLLLIVLFGGGSVYLVLLGRHWIYDYRFSAAGVRFVLFKCIPVGVVRAKAIREAYVFRASRITFSEWPSLALGNRFVRHGLFIRKRGVVRRLVLTPRDPWGALEALQLQPGRLDSAPVPASRRAEDA